MFWRNKTFVIIKKIQKLVFYKGIPDAHVMQPSELKWNIKNRFENTSSNEADRKFNR